MILFDKVTYYKAQRLAPAELFLFMYELTFDLFYYGKFVQKVHYAVGDGFSTSEILSNLFFFLETYSSGSGYRISNVKLTYFVS